MMKFFTSNLLASIVLTNPLAVLASPSGYQFPFWSPSGAKGPTHDAARFTCSQNPPIDPSRDGLLSSREIFYEDGALEAMVERHQPLVEIDSICYDDLGEFDEDPRWKPFEKIPGVLKDAYPYM